MKKIASFTVDHDKLEKGMYISRVDGDVVTYDIRMKKPNMGDYLTNGALHTFEHLFATYARNTELSPQVIYIGPMGCRTGFYFLLRDSVSGGRPPRTCWTCWPIGQKKNCNTRPIVNTVAQLENRYVPFFKCVYYNAPQTQPSRAKAAGSDLNASTDFTAPG